MQKRIQEVGFWDYTCPGHGSVEHYSKAEWDELLDEMAAGGFNSLVLGIKWVTTGYRSRHAWLDQDPSVTAIASDNAVLHHVLQGARRRGIATWLLVVASIFDAQKFGFPSAIAPAGVGGTPYDLDQPGVSDRVIELFTEAVELFGGETDGLVVELEFCDGEAPHRIPLFNAWATENGRAPFAELKALRLEPRSYPQFDWRDYTTSRRVAMHHQIEQAVRQAGFGGRLASLVELANAPGVVIRNVNLAMLHEGLPGWSLVTYDSCYDRRLNRNATMEFCIEEPRAMGWDVLYLTRGVMTFTWPPDAPAMDLREQWRMSIEDAARCRPNALWFMGSDARSEGMVVNIKKLPQWGFADGRSARRELMRMVSLGL